MLLYAAPPLPEDGRSIAHLCLPNFPLLSPIFLPFPMCQGLFPEHPSSAPLLHFILWLDPCSSLLWAGTMCPVPARPEGLIVQPPVCLPVLFVPSPSGGFLHVPKSYHLRHPRALKAATGGATRVVSLHARSLCVPAQRHQGVLPSTSGAIPIDPCPTRRTPPRGLSLGALTQPHHGTHRALPDTPQGSSPRDTPPTPGVTSRDAPAHPQNLARGLTTCCGTRARDPPCVSPPRRALTRVGPHVRLEVRALGVGLAAARVFTVVRGRSLARPRAAAALGLAVLGGSPGREVLQHRGVGRRDQQPGQPRRARARPLQGLPENTEMSMKLRWRLGGEVGRIAVRGHGVVGRQVGQEVGIGARQRLLGGPQAAVGEAWIGQRRPRHRSRPGTRRHAWLVLAAARSQVLGGRHPQHAGAFLRLLFLDAGSEGLRGVQGQWAG